MNKKKLIISLLIYVFFMGAFWVWFVLGAFFLASKNKSTEPTAQVNDVVIPNNPTFEPEQITQQEPSEATLTDSPPQTENSTTSKTVEVAEEIKGSGIPKSISIPKINVKTSVERVGLDSQGLMDVPSSYSTVAWYELGYKVGGRGSAVISGHYDNPSGQPAVFWDIDKLENGDLIEVVDTTGTTFTYKVVGKNVYPYNSLPMQQIFASNNKNMLNLITCSGTWDKTSKNYSTRTVIYSEQVQ